MTMDSIEHRARSVRSPSWARLLALPAFVVSLLGCAEEDASVFLTTADASAATASDAGPVRSMDAGATASKGDARVTQGDGSSAGGSALVTVKQGKLEGKVVESTRVFLGIPYAKPPTGELRFAAPEPAESWQGTRAAKEFGPSCPQPMGALSARGAIDEDCLSLNVYTPATPPKEKLPVMVFIHGGAMVAGGSSQYDGVRLSNEGPVVVVSINYRLGALGFLSHPALDEARGDAPSGNDALRDQQLALRWVKDNIAAFGGDAGNVTLFGESAGSTSTAMQMVSPTAQELAHRFIMESGTAMGTGLWGTKAANSAVGAELAKALCDGEADVIACLREKPAADVVAWGADRGISGAGWGATINPDDEVMPDTPLNLVKAGKYNKGEIIAGSNKNEWGLFLQIGNPPTMITTIAELNTQIDKQFKEPALASAVKAHYTATDATARDVFIRLMSDVVFRCPTRVLAREAVKHDSKIYLYSFEQGVAYHAFELPYVFGNPNATLGTPTLAEPLRAHVQGYWTQFAKSGDPNGKDRPEWPVYDTESDPHMALSMESAAGSGHSKEDCDFWDQVNAQAK